MAIPSLTTRAVVVPDGINEALHFERVPEIADEPNYHPTLAALK